MKLRGSERVTESIWSTLREQVLVKKPDAMVIGEGVLVFPLNDSDRQCGGPRRENFRLGRWYKRGGSVSTIITCLRTLRKSECCVCSSSRKAAEVNLKLCYLTSS